MKQKSLAQRPARAGTYRGRRRPGHGPCHGSPGSAHPAQTLITPGGMVGGPQALFGLQRTVGNAVVAREVAARRTFQADVFKGDATLETVLNDQGRLKPGDSGGSVQKVQEALIRDDVPLPKFGADAHLRVRDVHRGQGFQDEASVGFDTVRRCRPRHDGQARRAERGQQSGAAGSDTRATRTHSRPARADTRPARTQPGAARLLARSTLRWRTCSTASGCSTRSCSTPSGMA